MPSPEFAFEWNPAKAAANLRRHGVSFQEAATVFDDMQAYIQDDEMHSEEGKRQVILGYSERNRLLIVSFVQRVPDRIRLITARVATTRERRMYEE